MDFCKFFADIEKNPRAPIDITVGEYIQAADHVHECKACFDACTRVAEANPDTGSDPGIPVSLN